jgi:hypothetical protein
MTANTTLAPLLEQFFTQRLMQQRQARVPIRSVLIATRSVSS